MLLNYVRSLYGKDELQRFAEFLVELESEAESDPKAQELLKKYSILDDVEIPENITEIIRYGFVYDFCYAKEENVTEFPQLPDNVVELHDNKIKINYDLLTTYIIKRYCVVTFKKIIFIYRNGVFRENEGEIEKLIERILIHKGIADKKKIRDTVNEIIARIQWRTFFTEFPFNKLSKDFIPLKNGVLWRKIYYLLPFSPAFGFTYRLPVKYDPNAKCPKIEKFINEIVDPKNVPILYEIPATCLLQSPEYHVAYMLVGSGSNGKSTYLKLLERFLGKENVANVSLQDLCSDKFKVAQLVGKLANIYADLPKKPIKYTGMFKVLTGGDRITAERKYKDPFEFVNTARLIFAANELPEVSDQTIAFWRRWIVIEFPNTFPPNPDLINELTTEEELSGFLNKVLEALTRIEVKGITKTDVVEKIMEFWKKRSNSVYAFVVDCLERDADYYETKDDVYNAYVEYCEENDFPPLSKNVFAQELQKHIQVRTERKKIGGSRVYVWKGVRLKCRPEEEESEEGSLSDYTEYVVDIDGYGS